MNVPLEISFRGVEKTHSIEALIREKAARLERFCGHLSSCRIAVEKPQSHQDRGAGFRVRIDMTVPPGRELVAHRGPAEGDLHEELQHVIREAFAAAERQLKELAERQRRDVKRHPDQEVAALVKKIFPEEDYGFLRTLDGRQIYFHRNSVVNDEFDVLQEGAGVRFVEEQGEEGPQATTVHIVSPAAVQGVEKRADSGGAGPRDPGRAGRRRSRPAGLPCPSPADPGIPSR